MITFESGTMLHESNFLLETERDCYFIKTSSKQLEQDEQPAVTFNPINGCKPELDMTSISNPVTGDNVSALMNLNNGGITDMDISSFRKSNAEEKPDNDDEFSIGTKSHTEATINGHDCEEESNSFSLLTSVKHDLSTDTDDARGDILTEIGTCISLCSPESARQALKDLPVDEGISLEDKLPVVSGSCPAEELPKVKTSMADKIHCHNLSLEIIADRLKMIAMKDKEKNTERQGSSLYGLPQIKADDKGLLEESYDLHSLKVEEKHLCNSLVWDQNAEDHEIGSIPEKCIGEGLFSNKMGSVMKIPAEEAESVSESGILSAYQKENILEVPARDCERNSGLDLNVSSSTNCLDVRLQTSCTRMDDSVDSLIETTVLMPFSMDNCTSVESLDCKAGCDKCVASYANCAGEISEIPSHENDAVESSSLKGQNSIEKAEFPDGWTSETKENGTFLCTVNNSPLQASPVLASENANIQLVAESNRASKELNDASIISCLSSSMGVAADDLLFQGHFETSGLKPEKMEMMLGNVLGNPGILQGDSEGRIAEVDEHKTTVNGQKLLALSHCIKDTTEASELTENLSVDSKVTECDTAEKSGEKTPACVLLNVDGVQNVERQAEICVSGFSELPVVIRETEAKNKSYFDDQNTLPVINPRKDGNGTCEMTKRISIDSMTLNCSPSKDIAENNISTPALLKSDKTKGVRSTLTCGSAENSVSSTDNAQNLHEPLLDTFNEVNSNNDAAEMGSYTYSGPIPLSGPISYSGPIPFSGSLSLRSDSSTTSTRSFAFPILSSEWNSSPVKMVQADPRYFRKKRRWRFLCFCARESSFR